MRNDMFNLLQPELQFRILNSLESKYVGFSTLLFYVWIFYLLLVNCGLHFNIKQKLPSTYNS